jgi:hypothetical protein
MNVSVDGERSELHPATAGLDATIQVASSDDTHTSIAALWSRPSRQARPAIMSPLGRQPGVYLESPVRLAVAERWKRSRFMVPRVVP